MPTFGNAVRETAKTVVERFMAKRNQKHDSSHGMQMMQLPEDKEDFDLYRTERFEDRRLLYRPDIVEGMEQHILDPANKYYGTMIKGPPGIGKSHSLVNLVSHLRSQSHIVTFIPDCQRWMTTADYVQAVCRSIEVDPASFGLEIFEWDNAKARFLVDCVIEAMAKANKDMQKDQQLHWFMVFDQVNRILSRGLFQKARDIGLLDEPFAFMECFRSKDNVHSVIGASANNALYEYYKENHEGFRAYVHPPRMSMDEVAVWQSDSAKFNSMSAEQLKEMEDATGLCPLQVIKYLEKKDAETYLKGAVDAVCGDIHAKSVETVNYYPGPPLRQERRVNDGKPLGEKAEGGEKFGKELGSDLLGAPPPPPPLPNIVKPQFFNDFDEEHWREYVAEGPKVDSGYSLFLRAVSDASVTTSTVDPSSWNWPPLDDTDGIHVVSAKIKAGDYAMGEGIHLAKLPVAIPLSEREARNGLIIRNEDIGLIKACSGVFRSVVLGNPGISKSWHLWKYLVMAANPDVWKAVTSNEDKEQGKGEDFPRQPKVIIFVFGNAGRDPYVRVFFLQDKVVHRFKTMDVASVLDQVAVDGNVRMLYEPEGSYAIVPHSDSLHSKIPCTAALSPLSTRYKEFLKVPVLQVPHIMQCHSEEELEAVVRFFVWLGGGDQNKLENRLEQLQSRLKEVGPFLRVLIAETEIYTEYVNLAKSAVKSMGLEKLNQVMNSIVRHEKTPMPGETTHRCARYVTPKAAEGNFISNYLVPSSTFVLSRLREQLDASTNENLRVMVMRYQNEDEADTDNPKALESLTAKYILSSDGLQWQYAVCWLSFTPESGIDAKVVKENSMRRPPVNCKKTEIVGNAPKAREMKINVLYRPMDASYPFVDLLWVDEEASVETYDDEASALPPISSSQCSVSPEHAKDLSVYGKLRNSLGMPQRQLLIVYMTTIPRSVGGYLNGPVSHFFKGRKKRKSAGDDDGVDVPKNVEFRVVLPNKDMHNKAAEPNDYADLQERVYSEPAGARSTHQVASSATSSASK